MDQAASVFSQRGSALYVEFKPSLSARPITFPTTTPPLTFLVAQSFIAADKHVTAPICYNLRVVEVSLAATFLAKHLQLPVPLLPDASPLGISLRSVQDAYFGNTPSAPPTPDAFVKQLDKLISHVETVLVPGGYTREELAVQLGIETDELDRRFMMRFPVRAEKFKLRHRALHVFKEARRVLTFLALLEGETGPALEELGSLMDQSQESCRDAYECSCAELDELCKLAREAGSMGSRLTGAGWGGCSVHLVPEDRVQDVMGAWKRGYYEKRFPEMDEDMWRRAVVVSRPGSGSAVIMVREGKALTG
jgi:galactokinase